jgi:hypothetical protein
MKIIFIIMLCAIAWAIFFGVLFNCTYETDIDVNLVYCTTDENCPAGHVCVNGFCVEVINE